MVMYLVLVLVSVLVSLSVSRLAKVSWALVWELASIAHADMTFLRHGDFKRCLSLSSIPMQIQALADHQHPHKGVFLQDLGMLCRAM